MDWTLITSIIGVLGFLGSIFVFVLTRWEKRAKLALYLITTDNPIRKEPPEVSENEGRNSFIAIRIINIGGRAIMIDPNSFKFRHDAREILVRDCDWLGLELVPHPFNPGTSFEVAVSQDEFERLLALTLLASRDLEEQSAWVEASVMSLGQKPMSWNVKQKYWYAVGEFIR